MSEMFKPVLSKHTIYYMDDLISQGGSFQEMLQNIEELFQICREWRLKLNASKCMFFGKKVNFLGYEVSPTGIKISPEKLAAISQLKSPTSLKTLQGFIGYVNYFRKLVRGYSALIQPFQHLLVKGADWVWGPDQQTAFEQLKILLLTEPCV